MTRKDFIAGLFIAVILATLISPLASSLPDGLEKVAQAHGFIGKESGPSLWTSPVADYVWPGMKNGWAATGLAGLAGTLLALGGALGVGLLLRKAAPRQGG